MHIFITGVAGFLGSHLAEHFLKKNYTVTGNDYSCWWSYGKHQSSS